MSTKNTLKHIVVSLGTVVAVAVTLPLVMAGADYLDVPEIANPILVAPLQLAQVAAEAPPAGAASDVKKATHSKKKHAKKKHQKQGVKHPKKSKQAVEG